MASNSIQIYNDTVLKQSILQGYQVQRTNPNLGKITMGELAFTRDTGRLFVGNYTNVKKDDDSKQVIGGILSGNKYLGIIDSKPLIHFSASGDTGWKPLSYESDVTDNSINVTEKALFGQGSRFRNTDKNGWNKKSQYIEKYGVYSGDYTYDVYNNALILFDKNITTNPIEQPIRRVTEVNGILTEQILDKSTGEPISIENQTRRTPLYNTEQNDNLRERPIYGDGYVMMRILEPDGTTIGYKNRTFKYDKDNYNEDGSPTSNDNNWSHNYLEVLSVPASSLSASFDSTQFIIPEEGQGSVVQINSTLSKVNEITGISNKLTVPQTLSFKNSISLIFDNTKIESPNVNSDKILVLSKASDANTYNVSVANQHVPSYTIQLRDGLKNTVTGENFLTITQDASNAGELSIGMSQSSNNFTSVDTIGHSDPFDTKQFSNYYYNGTGYYDVNGSLIRSQFYDITYHEAALSKIQQYESSNNVGLNLLKNPIPICWNTPNNDVLMSSTSSAKLEYLVTPWIFCIKKHYLSGEAEPKASSSDDPSGDGTPATPSIDEQSYNKNITVLGNNKYDDLSATSSFNIIDGYSFDPQNRQMYKKYIQGNMNTTKIPVFQPVNFDVFDTSCYDESTINSTQDGYEVYTYRGQSINIPETIYKKDNTWYTYENNAYTPIQETISTTDVQIVTKLLATLKTLDDIIVIDEIKYPNNINNNNDVEKDEETGNFIESEMPDFLFSLEKTTIEIRDGIQKTVYVPYITFNNNQLIDLSNNDNFVRKVQISTSNKSKQFVTLFDSSLAEQYTPNNIYSPDTESRLSVHRTDLGQTIYSSLINAPIFTSSQFAPSFLLVTYEVLNSSGDLTTQTRYVKIQGINYSEIQPVIPENPIKVVAFKGNETIDITKTYKNDLFVSTNYMMFDTKKLQTTQYKGICFVFESNETQYFDIATIVKNPNGSYYTFTKEESRDVKTVKYRATGYWNVDTSDYNNDLFIIESVTLIDGTVYSWSNATHRNKIKDLITSGEINPPTGFSITYQTCQFAAIQIKNVPANKNGYFIPDSGLIADSENQRTIPAHASSILLEVHRKTNSNTPISIYTAADVDSMSDDYSQYDFPFVIEDTDSMPTINSPACLNENEKILYNSTQTGSQIIEVPLYKTVYNNYKGFTIRVTNIDSGNTTNNFLIRAIGYRV